MQEGTLTQATADSGFSSPKGVSIDEFKDFLRTDIKAVIAFARRLMRDEEAGRDLAQDALVKAFKNLDGFRAEASLKTWVMKITVNEGFKRLRRRRLKNKVTAWFMDSEGNQPRGYGLNRARSPEHKAGLSEQARLLNEAMQTLPHRQRAVVMLRFVDGLSVAEIAQITGVGQGTVKTHLVRALRKIRSMAEKAKREV